MSYQQKPTTPVPHKAAEVVQAETGVTKSAVALPAGPGQRLKAAREALNMSVEDVAAQLRLTRHRILEIEFDDYSADLAFTFIRGYLRAYAKLVGVNPDDVIMAFNALSLEDDRETLFSKPKQRKLFELPIRSLYWLIAAGVVGVALLVFGGWRMQVNSNVTTLSEVTAQTQSPVIIDNAQTSESIEPFGPSLEITPDITSETTPL